MVAIIKPGIILFSLIVLYLLYNNKAKVVKNIENPKDLAPPMIMKREVPKSTKNKYRCIHCHFINVIM